jgi:tetratricopeptide (TPR) repeat protein
MTLSDLSPTNSTYPRVTDTLFSARLETVLFLAALVIAGFLPYANSLSGAFILDDLPNIIENPYIRLTDLSINSILTAGRESFLASRPVANISFALNYYFHAYEPAGYHIVNILIHIATGILLFFFLETTLSMPAVQIDRTAGRWISFATALLWLVHPLQIQSVTYIVQRMNSLAAMFFLLAMLCYIKGRLTPVPFRKKGLFFGSFMSGLLAIGSKEVAITLPFFLLLYEWYFFQDLRKEWLKRALVPVAGSLALLLLLAFLYLGANPLQGILANYQIRDFTLIERVLTEFRVVFFYISLLFFPHPSRLNLDHDFPISFSLFDPFTTLLSLVGIVGLAAFAVILARRHRLLSFCILWFLGNLVIESSILGLELVFEHRLYLPSMMVILLVVFSFYQIVRPGFVRIAVLITLCLTLGLVTYNRNALWQSPLTLWLDVVEKSPNKARGYNEVGMGYYENQQAVEAIPYFLKSIELKPDLPRPHSNLGLYYLSINKIDLAIDEFKQAIQYGPGEGMYHINLGIAYMQLGMFDEANREIALGKEIRRGQKNTRDEAFNKPHP